MRERYRRTKWFLLLSALFRVTLSRAKLLLIFRDELLYTGEKDARARAFEYYYKYYTADIKLLIKQISNSFFSEEIFIYMRY